MEVLKRYSITVYILAILGLTGAWLWLKHLILTFEPSWVPLRPSDLAVALDALFTGVIAAIVLRIVAFARVESTIANFMVDMVLLKDSFLTELSRGQKRAIIQKLLQNLIANRELTASLNSFVDQYLSRISQRIRKSIRYEVEMTDMGAKPLSMSLNETTIVFEAHRYRILESHNIFELSDASIRRAGRAVLVFALDDRQLDNAFQKADCVLRELISLEDPDREKLLVALDSIEPLSLLATVKELFSLQCLVAGAPVHLDVTYEKETGINVLMEFYQVPTDKAAVQFDIAFRLPFAARENVYSIIYGEPTIVNTINFGNAGYHLEYYPLLTVGDSDRLRINEHGANRVTIVLNGQIVFPRSGIVFTWKPSG